MGDIAAGERREVLVPRPLQTRRPPWSELIDAPEDWTSWLGVSPARAQSPLRVSGSNLVVLAHGLRLDPLVALVALGAAARGFLGAAVEEVAGSPGRVRVTQVVAGSPFAGLGLGAGTMILSIDRIPIASPTRFRTLIGRHPPGEAITLEVFAGQNVTAVRVILAARPGSE